MKAMRLNGLTVKSEAFGNTYLAHPQVTDKPEEIGAYDVVFLTVKLYDSDEAIKMMKPLIGAGTVVVSFQNGLTAAEPLMKAFGSDMILGGVAYTMSFIETPGILHQIGRWGRFVIGRFAPGAPAHGEAIKDVIIEAGLEAVVSDNIREEVWKKFAYLASLSGMAALLRRPLGEILADPDTKAMLEATIMEVIRVSSAKGVKLEPTLKDNIIRMFTAMPPEMGTSMLYDMLQGKRLEVPWLSGTVSRFGHECNVPTPIHDAIYTALKLWA